MSRPLVGPWLPDTLPPRYTDVYSLVCPVLLDEDGKRIRGCGVGWTSTDRTSACPSCGELGDVRLRYLEAVL